jgi:hypothetical protein
VEYATLNISHSTDLSAFQLASGFYYKSVVAPGCNNSVGIYNANSIPEFWYELRNLTLPMCYGNFIGLGKNKDDVDVLAWLSGSPEGPDFDPFPDSTYAYAFAKDVAYASGTMAEPAEIAIDGGMWMGLHKPNAQTLYTPQLAEWLFYYTAHYVDDEQYADSGRDVSFDPDFGELPPPVIAYEYRGLPAEFGEQTVSGAGAQVSSTYPRSYVFEALYQPFTPAPVNSLTDPLAEFESVVVTDVLSGRPTIRWYTEGGSRGEMAFFRVGIYGTQEGAAAGAWTLVTNNPEAGEWRAPQLPQQIADLLADPSLVAQFDAAGLYDYDWTDFSGLLGTEGFRPEELARCDDERTLFNSTGLTEGRTRRSLYFNDYDYCD